MLIYQSQTFNDIADWLLCSAHYETLKRVLDLDKHGADCLCMETDIQCDCECEICADEALLPEVLRIAALRNGE